MVINKFPRYDEPDLGILSSWIRGFFTSFMNFLVTVSSTSFLSIHSSELNVNIDFFFTYVKKEGNNQSEQSIFASRISAKETYEMYTVQLWQLAHSVYALDRIWAAAVGFHHQPRGVGRKNPAVSKQVIFHWVFVF